MDGPEIVVDPAVSKANAEKAQRDADELRRRMPHLFTFETKTSDEGGAAPLAAASAPAAPEAASTPPTPAAPAVPATSAPPTPPALTLRTAHTLSTFELRNELDRRCLLSPELIARAGYQPFLQALVLALKEEQEAAEAEHAARAEAEHKQQIAEMLQRRKAHKAAAIARSAARQAEPQYFGKVADAAASSAVGEAVDGDGDGGSIVRLRAPLKRGEISIPGVQSRRVNMAIQPIASAPAVRKSRWG